MIVEEAFPYPIPEYGAEAYWDACNDEQLVMQKCGQCQKFRWHPAPLCTHCGAEEFSWEAISGRGKIYSWTVITHPIHPVAVERVPYIVVEVELEEQQGLRMLSNLIACEPAHVTFDQTVELAFIQHPNGQKLPVFQPG